MRNIESHIKDFCILQKRLVEALKQTIPNADYEYLLDMPKTGVVYLDGRNWAYQVHGVGVRFSYHGISIDMNRDLHKSASAFDAGRIAEYLASMDETKVMHKGNVIEFNHHTGAAVLRELATAKQIERTAEVSGEAYEFRTEE